MNSCQKTVTFTLEPADNQRLAVLCGECDAHIRQIEDRLGVSISQRGHRVHVVGEQAVTAKKVLLDLYADTAEYTELNQSGIHLALRAVNPTAPGTEGPPTTELRLTKIRIRGRNPHQNLYLQRILSHDVSFGIGPAGTGKTFLAVACAVEALEKHQVERLVLVRPAVEAGERLGFLPGDIEQKVDPYLRPLFDALIELLGLGKMARLQERGVIEIAPLAYMRGRTLNSSFVLLDEAQNTTTEQMKMFLTRLGFSSRAVITGDLTQVDLPRGVRSGLRQAVAILHEVKGISVTRFQAFDVVRHPLVQSIVEAYERAEAGSEPD
ncbi:MAG TPA: PhoH family protein [Gammaproteobacteria bacterium]|nr:PhoH family protein [Gammaproteobacteria bacterium]